MDRAQTDPRSMQGRPWPRATLLTPLPDSPALAGRLLDFEGLAALLTDCRHGASSACETGVASLSTPSPADWVHELATVIVAIWPHQAHTFSSSGDRSLFSFPANPVAAHLFVECHNQWTEGEERYCGEVAVSFLRETIGGLLQNALV